MTCVPAILGSRKSVDFNRDRILKLWLKSRVPKTRHSVSPDNSVIPTQVQKPYLQTRIVVPEQYRTRYYVGGDVEGLKDIHQVSMLQDHAQLMLAHHIKSHHFDYTFRFGRLLLLLPSLRQIPPDIIETVFFSKTIGSTPIVKLLGDLFKC
ncbi:photoreceptor-specific nuclear receptor [Trichonephila clavipes]|nr:photoreceptor-specific nuclear receptor [Trichonephila clavipes]